MSESVPDGIRSNIVKPSENKNCRYPTADVYAILYGYYIFIMKFFLSVILKSVK